jgi:hypothetical protein
MIVASLDGHTRALFWRFLTFTKLCQSLSSSSKESRLLRFIRSKGHEPRLLAQGRKLAEPRKAIVINKANTRAFYYGCDLWR